MVTFKILQELALSFPETTVEPHFEKSSFRVKKKIFVTYDANQQIACVKLSLLDQDLFSLHDKTTIYAVPNTWGKQGWTYIELTKVKKNVLEDIIKSAYCEVAPKKLADLIRK